MICIDLIAVFFRIRIRFSREHITGRFGKSAMIPLDRISRPGYDRPIRKFSRCGTGLTEREVNVICDACQ